MRLLTELADLGGDEINEYAILADVVLVQLTIAFLRDAGDAM
jgi:hypothetical protein